MTTGPQTVTQTLSPAEARVQFAPIETAIAGDTTLVAAVSGKKIRLLAITLVVTLAVAVRFKSAGNNNLTGAMSLGINGTIQNALASGLLETNVGEALVMNLGVAAGAMGMLTYVLIE